MTAPFGRRLLQRLVDKNVQGQVRVAGTDLIITIRNHERQTGRRLLATPA